MTQKGTDIDLPAEAQAAPAVDPRPQIVVEMTADHRIAVNKQHVELAGLAPMLREQSQIQVARSSSTTSGEPLVGAPLGKAVHHAR